MTIKVTILIFQLADLSSRNPPPKIEIYIRVHIETYCSEKNKNKKTTPKKTSHRRTQGKKIVQK